MISPRIVILSALSLLLPACGKSTKSTQRPAETSPESTFLGIPECDDYLQKWAACVSRMPAPAKSAAEPALSQMRESWKVTASSPGGKILVARACRAQMDALNTNPACK